MKQAHTYRVTFTFNGILPSRITNVRVIDGYSTTDDIPAILAVAITAKPSDADKVDLINVALVESTDLA